MFQWMSDHQPAIWISIGVSVLLLVVSIVATRAFIISIDAGYFAHTKRPRGRWANRSSAFQFLMRVGKNLLGALLILAGLAMLVLPGQGIVTLVIGLLLIDFPGKYRFEQWLISKPMIHRPINWLRRSAGRQPLSIGTAA